MQLSAVLEPWFVRGMAVLLAVQLVAGAIVLSGSSAVDPSAQASAHPADATPTAAPAGEPAAGTANSQPAAGAARNDRRIDDSRGRVGAIRVGMTIAEATHQLGGRLVQLDRNPHTRRFEYLLEPEGIRISGSYARIDTITVTSTGAGARYATTRGLKVGSSGAAVPTRYSYARLVCGSTWVNTRGKLTMRIETSGDRISSIVLTTRGLPTFAEC